MMFLRSTKISGAMTFHLTEGYASKYAILTPLKRIFPRDLNFTLILFLLIWIKLREIIGF